MALVAVVTAVGIAGTMWKACDRGRRVLPVEAGSRLLGVSGGFLYWLGPACSIWRARVEDLGKEPEPELLLRLGECSADDPRVDGAAVYYLGGMGGIMRTTAGERSAMLQRTLAFALAVDARYLYVGNCGLRDDCRIERVPTKVPGEATLLQAGIHALANMEVDHDELFWIDRGRRKPDCRSDDDADGLPLPPRCKDAVPPRLMAAPKDEPRAIERVVEEGFDGRRPFLGAHHVYWLGAGGVRRAPKSGGASEVVLPTTSLTGFAADGEEIVLAADAGIFRGSDRGAVRLLQRTTAPPGGVAIDATHIYWIDGVENVVLRKRR
jgi:hypothetical protein